ncbi:hypothetical protein ABEH62_21840, partial [Pantoea eucalypti]|uniref:hypothetical protein n=1 Tax=Pantoea eucalypti TaxID=470933 RepID=UPI003209F641
VLQRCELQAFERLERVALFILITENENDTSFQFSACSGLLKSKYLKRATAAYATRTVLRYCMETPFTCHQAGGVP